MASNGIKYRYDGSKWTSVSSVVEADDGYTYPGGVGRTIQDRLEDYVSVKDFGAVGDGVTDDTQAFKDAIASVRCIMVPQGSYIISSTITLPSSGDTSNRSLVGTYPNSSIRFTGTGSTLFVVPGGKASFEGLSFITEETSNYTNTCISDEQEMDDRPTYVKQCIFQRFGVAIQGNSNLACITDSQFLFNTTCINSLGPLMNSYVEGCMMQFNDYGVVLNSAIGSKQPEGLRIINNTIQRATIGVEVRAGLEILISSNVIDQTFENASAIVLEPDVSNNTSIASVKILDNWINIGPDTTSYGLRLIKNAQAISQVQVRGNTFAGSGTATAIDAQKCNTLQIADNVFKSNWTGNFPDNQGPVVLGSSVVNYIISGNQSEYGNPIDLQSTHSRAYKSAFTGNSSNAAYSFNAYPSLGMSSSSSGLELRGIGTTGLYFGAYDPNDGSSAASSANKGSLFIRQGVGALYIKTDNTGNVWQTISPG